MDMFVPDSSQELPPVGTTSAPQKTGFAGFLASTVGKFVVGGIALLVLLSIAGAVVFMFLFAQEPELELVNPAPGNTSKPVTADESEDETITIRPPRAETDTFVFRNPFKPTVKPVVVSETPSGSGGGTDSGDGTNGGDGSTPDPSVAPADTLYLQGTNVEDGVELATFFWNGSVYVLPEGQELEGTPWRVLRIEGGTVTMLYGDTQVSLSVGQGVGK